MPVYALVTRIISPANKTDTVGRYSRYGTVPNKEQGALTGSTGKVPPVPIDIF